MIKRYTPDVPYSAEIRARLALNEQRLSEPYYQMPNVFSPADYGWPGDKEGRALLAFVSHYKATGHKNPCMQDMLKALPDHLNEKGYLGAVTEDLIDEQQLAGHSWLLRGLCEHFEQFLDEFSLNTVKKVVEALYLPLAGRWATYPTNRVDRTGGEVSGHPTEEIRGWRLSSDTGTAFMAFDGLSHAYKITRDERIHTLLREMLVTFTAMDKVGMRMQTHCALTAARGMVRMYILTEDTRYLIAAKDVWNMYVFDGGMTATYQNLNFWRRPDTWTEPCAIVDSMILSLELYKLTRKDKYRRLAVRVFHNGLASAQRPNGGAGTDTVVFPGDPDRPDLPACRELTIYGRDGYEAPFCCSMRLAEGLWYANRNDDLLYYEMERRENGEFYVTKDKMGRYFCGDLLLGEIILPEGADTEGWQAPDPIAVVDGHRLTPLLKYFRLPDGVARTVKQKILFDEGDA